VGHGATDPDKQAYCGTGESSLFTILRCGTGGSSLYTMEPVDLHGPHHIFLFAGTDGSTTRTRRTGGSSLFTMEPVDLHGPHHVFSVYVDPPSRWIYTDPTMVFCLLDVDPPNRWVDLHGPYHVFLFAGRTDGSTRSCCKPYGGRDVRF